MRFVFLDDIIISRFSCGHPSSLLLCMLLDGPYHTQHNYVRAYYHSHKLAFFSLEFSIFFQLSWSQRLEIPDILLRLSLILYLPFNIHFHSVTKSWIFFFHLSIHLISSHDMYSISLVFFSWYVSASTWPLSTNECWHKSLSKDLNYPTWLMFNLMILSFSCTPSVLTSNSPRYFVSLIVVNSNIGMCSPIFPITKLRPCAQNLLHLPTSWLTGLTKDFSLTSAFLA